MDRRLKPRSIGVVTVARSDYGHLTPILESVAADPALALSLYVAGAHLAKRYGETVREVEKDGWPIAARIPTAVADDSPRGIAAMTARAVDGFGAALAADRPDILVVLGDRYEMLGAAIAALPFALPVAHVHGGEETEGAIDNQIRHAITKLAHLHFASAPLHAERIAAMGEAPWRIHAVGAPGLDRLHRVEPMSRGALADALGLPAGARWLVVTFHPATLEPGQAVTQVSEMLAALETVDVWAVITYPGADTEGLAVIAELEAFAARAPRARLVSHLGERTYLSLLRHAAAMVGNSSSGIIEAPSYELPVVNIGTRQAGRLRGANVIDVPAERAAIGAALQRALTPAFRTGLRGVANPYGDGHAAQRIVDVLRAHPLDVALVRKGVAA